MTARFAVLLVLASTAACSATRSSYQRTTTPAGELSWAFDGELTVTQNGRVVSDSGWAGLADAVSCVPRAQRLASTARSQRVRGTWIAVAGGLAGLAVLAGGTYVAIDQDTTTGLALIGAGTAVFGGTVITGASMIGHSRPKAFDAINIYNDEHQGAVACANARRPR